MSKYVTVSETIPLTRHTVEGLIDTIKEVFSNKDNKPFRIVYAKNEPLVVDRRVRQELASDGVSVSAYQMIRQHTDIDMAEVFDSPVRSLGMAVQALSNRDAKVVCLVTNNMFDVYSWFDPKIRPEKMINTKLIEDPDCPEQCLFVCGSKTGLSIKDIEFSILCRMD